MAKLFRYIFKNIFFAGWRVIFQHKEPDSILEEEQGAKSGKTLEELQKDVKERSVSAKPKEAVHKDVEYACMEEARAYDNVIKLYGFSLLDPAVKRLLRSKREGALLDIACGPGRFIGKVLKRSNFKATGLDLSPYMLNVASENIKKDGLEDRVAFHKGNLYDLPFKNESFDAVSCLNTLHHVEDIKKAVEGFEKMLKPANSIIVIQDLIKLPKPMQRLMSFILHPFPFTKIRKEMKKQYVKSMKGARSVEEWSAIIDSTFLKGAEVRLMFGGLIQIVKEINPGPASCVPIVTHISLFGHIRIFLTKIAYNILHFIVGSSIKITIEGEDNIPKGTQRALIVANHSSYLDVPIIGYTFFNNLIDLSWVVSKSNYKLWFLKWLWLIFKPIVVERGGTIDKIKKDLAYSRWVVLFPEGNERWCPPSEAAKKREKPSSGASVVALSTGVTIIPVGITGADKVLPARSFRMDTRHHITVRIGKPFSYDKVDADKIDQDMINETRQAIMHRVYPLVDYEHKDVEERPVTEGRTNIIVNIKKAIIAAISSGIVVSIVSMIFYNLFHGVYSLGAGSLIYRPYMFSLDVAGGSLLGGLSFINSAIFVIGYAILYNAIPGRGVKKGIIFSLFVWLIGIVIPVVRVYLSVNMALPVLLYWLAIDLSGYLTMGVLTGSIYKR